MKRVHLWCWPIDRASDADWAVLDASEQNRAMRFVQPQHRTAFLRAHGGLRAILGQWVGIAPVRIAFEIGPHGKPCLAGRRGPWFSLSHSAKLAAVAVSPDLDIGLDIERRRPIDVDGLATRFFSSAEQAALARLPPAARIKGFFEAWTRKEAFLKALGLGLTMPLDAFAVSLGPGVRPALLALDDAPTEPDHWQFETFCPAPGYLGAVAARARGWVLNKGDSGAADLPSGG
jgi:4'-phosphopantetheinyl transferase